MDQSAGTTSIYWQQEYERTRGTRRKKKRTRWSMLIEEKSSSKDEWSMEGSKSLPKAGSAVH